MTPERFQRVERIFHDARHRAGAEREALLAEACAGDSGLRRDVESLLAQAGPGVMDGPAAALAAALLPRTSRPVPPAAIGPFIVEALIGSGGMGDVYRARDTRLGRSVALKVLPDSFTTSADRVIRFRREAQLLAALNHPHIAQIHGVEDAGGTQLLVLELVEGDTLDKHIAAGPLAIGEALGIAAQVAAGLEAAHDKGIIHRDLKPANIALTAERQVKIFDFGLAKAVDPASEPDASERPDQSALTGVGVVLGTVAYMAPEQADGRRADKRVDVWAFGCVLFEMLTGARAFPGNDHQHTLAAVLSRPPEWAALPANTPAPVRRLLRRCLERDPAKRLKDIGDARLELADALASDADATDERREPPGSRSASRGVIVGLVGLLAIVSAVAALRTRRTFATPTAAAVQRLSLTFPDASPLSPVVRQFAQSPDGKSLAYVGANGGLWIRPLDGGDGRELPGTDDAWNPFFSPDGEWVGYIDAGPWGGGPVARPGTLKKVAVRGGVPVVLATAVALGGSWGRDGTIVYCNKTDRGVSLFTIPDSGGSPTPLTSAPPGQPQFRVAWPSRLPDDRIVVFSETDDTTFENGRTVALSLRTGERRVLLEQGYAARYVASGHLVYALNGSLMAVPFDASRLATTGRPVRVLDAVASDRRVGWLGMAVASTGTLLYDPGLDRAAGEQSLQWVARDGSAATILTENAQVSFPRLSPDGNRLAVGAGSDIWILDLRRGTRSRIDAKDRGTYPAPTITAWTADGRRLAINRRNTIDTSIVVVDPDDVEHASVLVNRPYFVQVGSWSKGGAFAFFQIPGGSSRDVWVIDPGSKEPRPFAATRFNERGAVFSPDGRWIAYAADTTGRDEVYVRAYPDSAAPVAVSTAGGTEPTWSRNGREIFYREGQRMMAVSFTAAPIASLGRPQLVFDQPFATSNLGVADYDVAADGRFILVRPARQAVRPTELSAVTNWFEDLRARAPVDATQ